MAFVLSDRIKETTTTTSTGTYTLGGAVSGFETFTANLSNSDTTYYCCTDGTDFEVGLGTFTSSGTTLARTTIISSSNSNNAVSWSSGSRDIFCTLPGSKVLALDGSGDLTLVGDDDNIQFDKSNNALEFKDSMRAIFGTGEDLIIQHASGNSIIRENQANPLFLQTNNTIHLTKNLNSETMAKFIGDGAVELYHDNSKKLETTSGGVTITGALTGDVTGDVTGNVSGTAATVTGAAQTNITSVGTLTGLTTSGSINLSQTSGTAIKTTGGLANADLGVLRASAGTGGNDSHGFTIKYMGSRTGNNNSYALFMDNQTGTDVEAMTVLQDGKVGINNTSPSAPLDVSGDAEITGTLTAGEVSATTLDIGGTNITATATEINKLDGVTATTTELNYVDVTTLGTVEASKAVTANSSGNITSSGKITADKLRLTSGSDVSLSSTNHAFQTGSTSGLNIVMDGNEIVARNNGSASTLNLNTNGGLVRIGDQNDGTNLSVNGNVTAESSDAGADEAPSLITYRNSSSPADSDELGEVVFRGRNDNSEDVDYAKIVGQITDASDGSEDGRIRFFAKVGGSDQTHFQIGFGTTDILGRMRLTGNSIFSNPVIIFEGSTANNNETTLAVTDPSQDNTVTLPDATGTVLTTGNSDTPTTTTSSSDADFVLVDDGGTMKKITPSNLGITSGGASKGFAVAMAIAL